MHSSKEQFLLDCIQFRQDSRLMRVSGKCGNITFWKLVGRVSEISEVVLTFKGRGFEIEFLLSGVRFERDKLSELPLVVLRPDDPQALFRPIWTVTWRNRDFLLLFEVPVK
jgi:hypothetical protein